jgi:hypothetical protein
MLNRVTGRRHCVTQEKRVFAKLLANIGPFVANGAPNGLYYGQKYLDANSCYLGSYDLHIEIYSRIIALIVTRRHFAVVRRL